MVFGLSFPRWKRAEPPPSNDPTSLSGKNSSGGGTNGALTVNEFVARTKRCKEKGLEPTKPELYAYARYLGIDPFADGDLMWLVDEALKAPLPAEWTEHHDGADRVFYYNSLSHTSSWTHPLEDMHRQTYKTIVNFRNSGMSKQEQNIELDNLRRKVEDLERETHDELQAWSDHVDEDGQKFFFNREKQRSFWTDPRLAPCHTLYLQMKVLRVLSECMGRKWVEPLSSDFKRQMNLSSSGDAPPRSQKAEHRSRQDHLVPLSARSTEASSLSARSTVEPTSAVEELALSDSPRVTEKSSEKKRKKKSRRDRENKELELEVRDPDREHRPASLGPRTASLTEEVRAPAGVSPRHLPPMSGRGRMSGNTLGGIGQHGPSMEEERLHTPRRPKVRPGIKLMPLS